MLCYHSFLFNEIFDLGELKWQSTAVSSFFLFGSTKCLCWWIKFAPDICFNIIPLFQWNAWCWRIKFAFASCLSIILLHCPILPAAQVALGTGPGPVLLRVEGRGLSSRNRGNNGTRPSTLWQGATKRMGVGKAHKVSALQLAPLGSHSLLPWPESAAAHPPWPASLAIAVDSRHSQRATVTSLFYYGPPSMAEARVTTSLAVILVPRPNPSRRHSPVHYGVPLPTWPLTRSGSQSFTSHLLRLDKAPSESVWLWAAAHSHSPWPEPELPPRGGLPSLAAAYLTGDRSGSPHSRLTRAHHQQQRPESLAAARVTSQLRLAVILARLFIKRARYCQQCRKNVIAAVLVKMSMVVVTRVGPPCWSLQACVGNSAHSCQGMHLGDETWKPCSESIRGTAPPANDNAATVAAADTGSFALQQQQLPLQGQLPCPALGPT